jgi:hypothetical protein
MKKEHDVSNEWLRWQAGEEVRPVPDRGYVRTERIQSAARELLDVRRRRERPPLAHDPRVVEWGLASGVPPEWVVSAALDVFLAMDVNDQVLAVEEVMARLKTKD